MKPPYFDREPYVEKAKRWIESIEKIFKDLICKEDEKITFTTFKREKAAEHW